MLYIIIFVFLSRFNKIIPNYKITFNSIAVYILSQSRCVEFKMMLCDFNPVKSQDANVQSILPNSPDFRHFRYICGKHPSRHLQNLSKLIAKETHYLSVSARVKISVGTHTDTFTGKFSSVMSKLFSYLREPEPPPEKRENLYRTSIPY